MLGFAGADIRTMPSVTMVAGSDQQRVLLINDDIDLRLELRSTLASAGWTVEEAASATEAITIAQRCQAHVILLAFGRSESRGREQLAELKASAEIGPIPVVVLSRQGGGPTTGGPLREGAQDCIQIPFSLDDLDARLGAARQVGFERGQMQRAQENCRQLLEVTGDAVFSIDAEGIVTSVNSGLASILGRGEDQIIGRSVLEFMDNEAQTLMTEQLKECQAGMVGSYENRFLNAAGRNVRIRLAAMPIYRTDGAYEGSVATATILSPSEAKYKLSFEHGPTGMAEVATDGRFIRVNPALCEIFGYTAEQLCAMTPADLCLPEDADQVRHDLSELNRLAAPGRTSRTVQQFSAEQRYRHASGRVVWCVVSASAVFDEDRRLALILTHFVDISDKKATEFSLVDSERRSRAIFDLAPVGLAELSMEGRFTRVNPAVCDIFGYSGDQLVTMAPSAISHPEESEMVGEIIAGLAQSDVEDLNYTRRFIHASGKVIWCVVRAVRIRGTDGAMDHFLAGYLDITDRREFERQLEHMAAQAKETAQLKSNFLANMSHEIRTPMIGVIGMTELLLETDLDDVQRDYAETVRSSSDALMTVINEILDYSKIEAGKLDIEKIEFSLPTVVNDVIHVLTPEAESNGLRLAGVVDDSVPTVVRGDPFRARQVLLNLVGNAIKFTEIGEVSVHVTEFEALDEGVVLRFEVADTGVGISPEKLDRIFQPFVQADMSTSRIYGGRGLGLSISGQLVALMGGDCGVSSQLGKGSTFWFTICVQVVDESATHNGCSRDLVADPQSLRPRQGSSH